MVAKGMNILWNGFECVELDFEGHSAVIVLPNTPKENPVLLVKTEYFNAFPETEIAMLERGHYLCFIENDNRWGTDTDLDRKARFIRFVQKEFSLGDSCIPVGMSCGGLFAIKFAAKFPEMVACLYLDAPVLNYMSCPCGFGIGQPLNEDNREILDALGMKSISDLICYRDMPMDRIPALVSHQIPVIMVAGDSDFTVPYCENGALLEKAYTEAGMDLEVYIKPGCAHHPHGLEDNSPIVAFIERYC